MIDRFWVLVHNCFAHPVLGVAQAVTGRTPEWAANLHHWSIPNMYKIRYVGDPRTSEV
jgi:hypothetical protein